VQCLGIVGFQTVHCVTGCHSQLLKIVCVLVDITEALEVRVGLKLGEGLVLLVLLCELEVKLSFEPCPGREREGNGRRVSLSLLSGVVGSEGLHVEIGYYIGFIHILTLPLSYVIALFVP
jgi:hypothetical protein